MWTDKLAVLGMVTVKAHGLKSFRPSVSTQPAIHAGSAFADLASMFGTGTAFHVINREKDWP